MPRVVFTQNLQRHVTAEPQEVEGATVAAALDATFKRHPKLKGYLLDDQGTVRKHVTIFLDGSPIRDREALSDTVSPETEIYVMQALSGG